MKQFRLDYLMKSFMLLLFMVGMSSFAYSQRTISGTITDGETNEPLIGANILVAGTSTGTTTDFDGKYSFEVPEGATELEISYTGYATQTVTLGASNVVDLTLSAGSILDEVVVVGYGSVKKSDATGALTSVTEKDFNKGVITSPEQLIQGRAAGVQITTASGEPGAGINVRIRGTSSVRTGNNPLFVVDGVPLSGGDVSAGGTDSGLGSSAARNPLNFLNPNDIKSIDILKDASATAIYGSRGANGVVIITTKGGSKENAGLDYNFSLGVNSITKKYDLLSAQEFAAANPTQNQGASVDWQDQILQSGFIQSHNLSYGAATDKGNYRISLSYLDQEGIIKNSGINRVSARFSGTTKFFDDKLTVGTSFTIADVRDDNVPITDNSGFEGDLLAAALKTNPTMPIMDVNDIDGDGITDELTQPGNTEPNPLAMLEFSRDKTETIRALGNINAEYAITEKFKFKTVLGFDRSFSDRFSAFSGALKGPGITGQGRLFLNDVQTDNRLWENYFTYTDEIASGIDFTGLVGYSYQQFNTATQGFEMTNFRTEDLDVMVNNIASIDLSNNQLSIVPINSTRTKDELQSFFARVNLGIQDKYLFTASVRADGSTRFGDDERYGIFPSAAFKWRAIQEEFLANSFFDDLGLRIGVGVTGNQEIPHNLFQPRTRFGNFDINSSNSLGGGNIDEQATRNSGLKWESTVQYNLGVDFAFSNYRVSGTLDLYRKNTNDLLFRIVSAQPAEFPFVWTNLDADVINQGIELGLNVVLVDKADFDWNLITNVAYNDNEVQNLVGSFDTGAINGQGLTGAFAQRIASGQPLFAYFLREFGGFDDQGNSIYLDADGKPGGDFQQFIGKSPLPVWNLGITNTFSYKDFDFSFFFTGQFGHYIYSNTENAFFTQGSLANGRNVTRDVINNGEGNLNAPDVSTRFLEKGDFLRLQNVSIGYNIPVQSDVIKGLRIGITGQNLFVITGYSGQDPEVNTNKQIDGIPSFGIDYTPYPRARTFMFNASVSF